MRVQKIGKINEEEKCASEGKKIQTKGRQKLSSETSLCSLSA